MYTMDFSLKNGWILSLVFLSISYLPVVLGGPGSKRLFNFSWINKTGKMLSGYIMILFLVITALPCFYEIEIGNPSFILGGVLFFLGAAGVGTSYVNYFSTPGEELVCRGIYRISRNPIYLSVIIMALGMVLFCRSWLIFLCLCLYTLIQHPIIREEERFCIEHYGKAYLQYKTRTRRYL